ncbi:MAG: MBL fold metallo-hydrolase [Candidatus Woesearchaeota archaeon]|nr:MBL fold metallo-hydrolase [Candidatus Woesearchaeota archaeon]
MIEIIGVSGYSEIGRNMTAVRYNDEVVILDMGIHLENYIMMKGEDEIENFSLKQLMNAKAVPDDRCINHLKDKVIGIIPSHGHLDHIGAIPFMAQKYDCPIICTPYTASVIKSILRDKKKGLPNEIVTSRKTKLTDSITIEFIDITHSIPDAAIVVIHTPDGKVVYANDFKLDDTPTFGNPPDYERLKSLKNVKALILDSLYANLDRKTPSELVAKEMLSEVMLRNPTKGAVVVTTFSSHIARLKTILELSIKMKRQPVMLGRSLGRYVYAAEDIKLVDFSKKAKICNFKKQMVKMLKDIAYEKDKYLVICTGHQGEPDAVLSKIVNGELEFPLGENDQVIFSCTVIPSQLNIENRKILDENLLSRNVQVFRDVHASGHASRQDHKKFIELIGPQHIIPAHAGKEKTIHMKELALEIGYDEKHVHLLDDGDSVEII